MCANRFEPGALRMQVGGGTARPPGMCQLLAARQLPPGRWCGGRFLAWVFGRWGDPFDRRGRFPPETKDALETAISLSGRQSDVFSRSHKRNGQVYVTDCNKCRNDCEFFFGRRRSYWCLRHILSRAKIKEVLLFYPAQYVQKSDVDLCMICPKKGIY